MKINRGMRNVGSRPHVVKERYVLPLDVAAAYFQCRKYHAYTKGEDGESHMGFRLSPCCESPNRSEGRNILKNYQIIT